MRPLEYWRNEKKSYGRSHNSLPTVKTVDLASPNPEWPAPRTRAKTKAGGTGAAAKGKRKAAPKEAAPEVAAPEAAAPEAPAEVVEGGAGSDTASED